MISDSEREESLALVSTEMQAQAIHALNGRFDDAWKSGISDLRRLAILAEEFGEAAKDVCELMHFLDKPFRDDDPILVADYKRRASIRLKIRLHAELIQVAAVAASWASVLTREIEVLKREKFQNE
jgi:hypothetical protein